MELTLHEDVASRFGRCSSGRTAMRVEVPDAQYGLLGSGRLKDVAKLRAVDE